MKQNRKRVLLVLGMAACLFALTACSSGKAATSLEPNVAGALKQQTEGLLQNILSIPINQMGAVIQQNRNSGAEALAAGLEDYVNVEHELGTFISAGEGTVEDISGGYKITVSTLFEKRPADFEVTVDQTQGNITSMAFVPIYTLGERMEKAGLNTLMGMCTVFIVLIFISVLISGFRHINAWEEKRKKQKTGGPVSIDQAPVSEAPGAEVPATHPVENLADDHELAAVITAAIAASENTSADGLVVRSIRRASAGKWKRS